MTITRRLVHIGLPVPLVLFMVLALSTGLALAHAQYAGSTPAANANVPVAPTTLQIAYTQELSDVRIKITGPDGSEVTTAPATFDLEHRHNASVGMRDAGPGQYTVVWHNVSGDDGDPERRLLCIYSGRSRTSNAWQPVGGAHNGHSSFARATRDAQPVANLSALDKVTPGINDVRVNTYRKRQAIRDKYRGQINEATSTRHLLTAKVSNQPCPTLWPI